MSTRKPGPKLVNTLGLDLSELAPEFPQRAFDLLEQCFGLTPYKWQREQLVKIFTKSSIDRPPVAYTQVARKNGKTLLGVMVALVELCLYDEHEIYAVSDSQTNLSSVFWLQLNSAINKAGLDDFFTVYQLKIVNPVTGSFIQMRPGNFAASQGINPHLVLVDELHLMNREVWHGYLMSTDAREDGLVFAITTPGYNMDSAAFDIYNEAKEGNDPELHATIYEPLNSECPLDDRDEWKRANPAYDESPALQKALERHSKRMRENDFRRFRLGQWTATENAWLPYGAAAALVVDEVIAEGARVCLALDGSWSGDTTGLTATSEDKLVQVVGHWAPPVMNDGQWRVDMSKVEQAIRDACAYYDVVEIAFDPARWSRNMQALAAEGLPVVEFPQSKQRMVNATTLFYDAVCDGNLRISNNDYTRALLAHLGMAEVEESKDGAMIKKPTFVEAKANIDLAVSAVMSHARAVVMPEPTDWSMQWVAIQ